MELGHRRSNSRTERIHTDAGSPALSEVVPAPAVATADGLSHSMLAVLDRTSSCSWGFVVASKLAEVDHGMAQRGV